MKKTSLSRRRFIFSVSVAGAAVAAGVPVVKKFSVPSLGNKRSLAVVKEKVGKGLAYLKPEQMLTRPAGSHRLPLVQRPL